MVKKINRRSLIKTTAASVVTGLAASSLTASPAFSSAPAIISKDKYNWNMVMTWPKNLPGVGTGAERLAERITTLSKGRINIKLYGSGELLAPAEVFDAVAQGTVEMGHSSSYYWLSKNRAAAFFSAVPGGMVAQEQAGWLYFGGGQQLWDELYGQFGVKAFPAGQTGTQMGGWFKKELHSLEDLKGLRMRISGLAGEVYTKIGGSAQVIPASELFISLQSGVIDALEWIGPWNDLTLGFHSIAKYYYGPAFQEGGSVFECLINKNIYDSLPEDLQTIIKVACATEHNVMYAEFFANNARALDTLINKHGVMVKLYPEDILKAFFETSEEVLRKAAEDGGDIGKRIYESYYNYRKLSMPLSGVTELKFLEARDKYTRLKEEEKV